MQIPTTVDNMQLICYYNLSCTMQLCLGQLHSQQFEIKVSQLRDHAALEIAKSFSVLPDGALCGTESNRIFACKHLAESPFGAKTLPSSGVTKVSCLM